MDRYRTDLSVSLLMTHRPGYSLKVCPLSALLCVERRSIVTAFVRRVASSKVGRVMQDAIAHTHNLQSVGHVDAGAPPGTIRSTHAIPCSLFLFQGGVNPAVNRVECRAEFCSGLCIPLG